jgi:hypothetical protein
MKIQYQLSKYGEIQNNLNDGGRRYFRPEFNGCPRRRLLQIPTTMYGLYSLSLLIPFSCLTMSKPVPLSRVKVSQLNLIDLVTKVVDLCVDISTITYSVQNERLNIHLDTPEGNLSERSTASATICSSQTVSS